MIISFRNGRLGNQLFQYAFLNYIAKENEKIVLIGFPELKLNFNTKNVLFLLSNAKILNYVFPKIKTMNFDFLIRIILNKVIPFLPLFSYIEFDDNKNKYKIIKRKTLLNNVFIVKNFFSQSDKYINYKKLKSLNFKLDTIIKSKEIINNLNIINRKIIFIHIRLDDYENINHGMKINLPLEWYNKCIEIFDKEYQNPFFIIMSDDTKVYKYFNNKNKFFCSRNNFLIDFCLMSLCDGGILSASSFSWWGAWFANNQNDRKIFLGPKYWMGFSKTQWFPKHIETNFIRYIDTNF